MNVLTSRFLRLSLVLCIAGFLFSLNWLTSPACAQDTLTTWADFEEANFEAITSVEGDLWMKYRCIAPGNLGIAQRRGFFASGDEGDLVSIQSDMRFSLWYDLANERFRANKMVSDITFCLLSAVHQEKGRVSLKEEDLLGFHRNLWAADNFLVVFKPRSKYGIRDPNNLEKVILVKQAVYREGPSSTELLQEDSGISLQNFFNWDIPIIDRAPSMCSYARQQRDMMQSFVSENTSSAAFFFDESEDPVTGYTRFAMKDTSGDTKVEWVIDPGISACIRFKSYGPLDSLMELVWDWELFDGIVFPVSGKFCTSVLLEGERKTTRSLEFAFSNLSINQPIDSQRFTYEDLGLRPGDYINDITNGLAFPLYEY